MNCVRELRVKQIMGILNGLTLGRTNGSQTRGKNKNSSANALPNVHAPIWLVVFVIPVWLQCPHLTITGLFPKSDLRIPRSQRVVSMAVAVTTGVFSSSAVGDDMVKASACFSQKNDEFRYHKNTKIAEVKYVPYHTRVFAHKFLPPRPLSHDTQLCVVVSLFPFPKPKADAT